MFRTDERRARTNDDAGTDSDDVCRDQYQHRAGRADNRADDQPNSGAKPDCHCTGNPDSAADANTYEYGDCDRYTDPTPEPDPVANRDCNVRSTYSDDRPCTDSNACTK